MKKEESAAKQLQGIIDEMGPHDYQKLTEHMHQLFLLDNPPEAYKEGIMKEWKGSWEAFVLIWRSFHLYSISKSMWRKMKTIAKRYPNFDTIIKEMATEINDGHVDKS